MKNAEMTATRKFLSSLALLTLFVTILIAGSTQALAANKTKPTKLSATSKSITTYVGTEFDLKVKMTPTNANDNYLTWSVISGKSYVKIIDDDVNDDDIELKAVKAGTAKVRCRVRGTSIKCTFTIKVKAATNKITAKSATTQSVEVGDEFELEVNKYSGLKDRYLKWSIADTSIVRFEDSDEKTGDDVEFVAKKAGTTTITCKNTKTSQKIKFTVTVTKASTTIKARSATTQTVAVKDDFELEVKKYSGLKDRYLKWSIADTSIVRFEESDETTGDEVEFYAKKTGTTTITCTNTQTNQTITFTIKVVK
ncbi:MAG: hypothetical protein LUF34_07320 [Lachnospiraceae bacterium]|nr:hypothetical protein [Lachnospiraceae bacterium]